MTPKRVLIGIAVFASAFCAFSIVHAVSFRAGVSDALNNPHKYRPVSTTQWVERGTP